MCLTRNEHAVHERCGEFRQVDFFNGMRQVVGPDIDLRLFSADMAVWIRRDRSDPRRRTSKLSIFRRWGRRDSQGLSAEHEQLWCLRRIDSPVAGRQIKNPWQDVEARSANAPELPDAEILDEPISNLDPAHQHVALRISRRIAVEGAAVLIVLHDLNLAAQYSDRLVLMKSGRIAASGTPAEVMREDLIGEVFGVRAHVAVNPVCGAPAVFVEAPD